MNARAPKGLGSINQRSNGRWVWQADLGTDPETDRRIRPTRERSTRAEVLAARDLALEQLQQKRPSAAPTPGTVAEWYNHWLRLVAARPDGSPNTYANYEIQVRKRIIPGLGTIQLAKLTTAQVVVFLDGIGAPATRVQVHKTLARGWHEAFNDERVTDKDVVSRAPAKRSTGTSGRTVARATTKEEVTTKLLGLLSNPPTLVRETIREADLERIFKTLERERMRARYVLGLVAGPRQSETLGFCWPWLINPTDKDEPGVLNLHTTRVRDLYAHGCHERSPCGQTPQRCPRRHYLDPIKGPKSDGSVRQLFLGPGVLDILNDWKGLQTLELTRLATPPVIPWMFTASDGRPISHSSDTKTWRRILDLAGVSRHYTVHDLRRSAASEAASDPTIDKATLMGMFGWTRSSTADLYTRPQDARLKEAFKRQDRRLTNPGK